MNKKRVRKSVILTEIPEKQVLKEEPPEKRNIMIVDNEERKIKESKVLK